MKKNVTKILSLLLVVASGCSIASCSSKEEIIPENSVLETVVNSDSVWYEANKTDLSDYAQDVEDFEYANYRFHGMCDDLFVISRETPATNINRFADETFVFYNRDGEIIRELSIPSIEDMLIGDNTSTGFMGLSSYHNGVIDISFEVYDSDMVFKYINATADATTFEIISTYESSDDDQGQRFYQSYNLIDHSVDAYSYKANGFYSYEIAVKDLSGNENRIDLASEFPNLLISTIDAIVPYNEGSALIAVTTISSTSSTYLKLDLNSMTVSTVESDLSFLPDNLFARHEIYVDDEYGALFIEDDYIGAIDFENQEIDRIFSFDNTNVNRFALPSMEIASYSEGEICLVETSSLNTADGNDVMSSSLITLTRMDTNPNEGKMILRLASVGGSSLSYGFCESVVNFNNTSEDSFIIYDDRYEISDSEKLEILNQSGYGGYQSALWERTTELSNQLSIDLMTGEGPDIMYNAFDIKGINNSSYLMDLSELVPEEANDHVIELAMEEDGLFQMPTSYSLFGLVADPHYIEEGQVGFTYEEYTSFIDEIMNGTSPHRGLTREDYLAYEFGFLSDTFVDSEGDLSFENAEFSSLAGFIKDCIFTPVIDENCLEEEDILSANRYSDEGETLPLYYQRLDNPYNLQNHLYYRDILGLPSHERRSAGIMINTSVAISSNTVSPEAAKTFLSSCLLSDVQRQLDGIPMSDSVLTQMIEESIEVSNSYINSGEVDDILNYMSYEEATLDGTILDIMDGEFIDRVFDIVNGTSTIIRIDSEIMSVLNEELPPYFDDSKTYDEVITIIEDKIDTMNAENEDR